MSFQLTRAYLQDLVAGIEQNDLALVHERVNELHPVEIADIIKALEVDQAKFIFNILSNDVAASVLVELPEDQTEILLNHYTSKEIAEQLIDSLESDDAAYILNNLNDQKKQEVLSFLTDVHQAGDLVDLLNYDEGTAGAIMAKELIRVKEDWTVSECIREMRKQARGIERVLTIYVVNDDDKLLGTLSLKALLMAQAKTSIKRKYNKDVISVKVHQALEEVASTMEKYDLVVVPVIDDIGRLVGRITIDDVIDFIKDEADKDYQIASGYSEVVEDSDSIWIIARSRLPWLLIGLLGGILGSRVIAQYEDQIQLYPEMAYFIPLIAAMAGNAGVQASAIVVQALANNSMSLMNLKEKLGKEFRVSLINGLACSIVIFIYNVLVKGPLELGITISSALLSVIVFATLLGASTPLILNRYKIDPAIATGPFITTINDILGLLLYFAIGRMMYL